MAVTVALDAGHGGFDSGAVENGRREKDDNLALTLAVGEILQRNGVDFRLPRRLLEQVEENCDQKQLLGVLLRAGMLQNYQIPIMEVDIPEKSYYNASTVINIE